MNKTFTIIISLDELDSLSYATGYLKGLEFTLRSDESYNQRRVEIASELLNIHNKLYSLRNSALGQIENKDKPVVDLDQQKFNCKNCGHIHTTKKACECRCIAFWGELPTE